VFYRCATAVIYARKVVYGTGPAEMK